MRQTFRFLGLTLLFALSTHAQNTNYPYILKSFAGSTALGDGGPATSAYLSSPRSAIADAAGNILILDSGNGRIRKVTPDGRISTLASVPSDSYHMVLGPKGDLFVATLHQVLKVSPAGAVSVIAGTGVAWHSGDDGPALKAEFWGITALAVDSEGNIYVGEDGFIPDGNAHTYYIREILTSGAIRSIAGAASTAQIDGTPASQMFIIRIGGIAIGGDGTIFYADNKYIRRFTIGGTVSTLGGNGSVGMAVDGPWIRSPFDVPTSLYLEPSGTFYVTDFYFIMKVSPGGILKKIAGNLRNSGAGFPNDGPALGLALGITSVNSVDAAGNPILCDGFNLVRKIMPDGNVVTIAGKPHNAGDNGPAISATVDIPTLMAAHPDGSVYFYDSGNFLIRRVATDGTITTAAGKPFVQLANQFSRDIPVFGGPLPPLTAMTFDATGNLYFSDQFRVYKLSNSTIAVVAGRGEASDERYGTASSGDGGKATDARFGGIEGLAVDSKGNVYIGDPSNMRVRKVDATTGIISAFAGHYGQLTFTGDGGPAVSAGLGPDYNRMPLAVDSKGNVYIGDGSNKRIRVVDPSGIINTFLGNGALGRASGPIKTSPFSIANSMVFDSSGAMYVNSVLSLVTIIGVAPLDDWNIYKIENGIITAIAGNNNGGPLTDGTPALSTGFHSNHLAVDANGDLYASDPGAHTVRKLVLNSPKSFTAADGADQTGGTGQNLAKALKVQLLGRSGFGIAGVTVTFAVTTGSAKLGAATATTDVNGFASTAVSLGDTAGAVTITATASGVTLPPVGFNETAIPCSVPQPAISSARSVGDFGGSATFAAGSWLEVKGSNLAPNTRTWSRDDFQGSNAPTALDGVTVTINGKRAFIGYISPTQINVQAPADSATGTVGLTVSPAACASASISVQKAAVAPGLLAPSVFNVGGRQYLAALFLDGVTYVGNPGLISGVPFRPAKPGESIALYGIGFGDVTPSSPPGVVASGSTSVAGLTVSFGSTQAKVTYGGLAPNSVGLYQVNVTVPDVADGDYVVTLRVGNTAAVPQNMYLTVKR